ncbi:histidine phosphatase family protein [Nanoarchaeota archaeon]
MKIIYTRHGETFENQKKIIQGRMDSKLTENGIQQAESLALRLKDEKIDAIYTSPLSRAVKTGEIINKFHNVKLTPDKRLIEADVKSFTGVCRDDIDPDEFFKTVEQPIEMITRLKSLLNEIYPIHKDDTVMLVGHQGIGKALMMILMNKDPSEIRSLERLNNTSLSIFKYYEDKNHEMHLFNCTEHLDKDNIKVIKIKKGK